MQLIPITPEQVKMILADEELFSRVAEDGVSFEDYIPPAGRLYLGIWVDHTLIGFWTVYGDNSVSFNIHCHVLEGYRNYSVEVGTVFLDYMFSKYDKIQKLNAKIPEMYPDVCTYIKKFGFKQEGVDRKSIMKNGELVDRLLFGLTRGDYNE